MKLSSANITSLALDDIRGERQSNYEDYISTLTS